MNEPNQPTETIQRKGPSRTGLYAGVAVVVVVILAVAGLWATGYLFKSTPPGPGTCPAVTILGAGSTFVNPLVSNWGSLYQSHNMINYASVGSSAGISQITAKTVMFGATDAPLNTSQRTAAPGVLTMPETAGAVAIIINLPAAVFKGSYSLNLTGAVLAQIYLGQILNWNVSAITSLNPGAKIPTQNITSFHRSDGSGTSYAFTDFLSQDSASWMTQVGKSTNPTWPKFTGAVGAKGSSTLAGDVKGQPYSIGYVDLNYALNNGISTAAVKEANAAGKYILPSVNDSASAIKDSPVAGNLPAGGGDWSSVSLINAPGAGDYPIVTFSYFLFYQAADANSLILNKGDAESFVNWLTWTITMGQGIAVGLYYVQLPASVVTADQATLASMTYGGSSIPACT
ncbi:MAG: phosphate ABC transporter substrate-binding protein PstS [Thermoplasmata archaeon]|nr:phosphate ABC transporter substrate-binding protein PstS [Thermoplasmata archaeon]